MAAGPIGAGLVQHALADIFPERIGSEVFDGIDPLHLDDAGAARAFDAQDMALDVGEAALLDQRLGLSGRAGVGQQARPELVWHRIGRSRARCCIGLDDLPPRFSEVGGRFDLLP